VNAVFFSQPRTHWVRGFFIAEAGVDSSWRILSRNLFLIIFDVPYSNLLPREIGRPSIRSSGTGPERVSGK
jgi:hypothetical protein